jgi:hypothetical protein
MRRSRYNEEQIIATLREHEDCATTSEAYRRSGQPLPHGRLRHRHTVTSLTFSRSASSRMLSPSALPSMMRARIANAVKPVCDRSFKLRSFRIAHIHALCPYSHAA